MKRILTIPISVMSLLLIFSCGNKEVEIAKTKVIPFTVKDTSVLATFTFPATMQGVQDVAIFPQVTGRIMKVLVKEGQRVEKNQVLFEIDDVPFTSAYDVALANLEMSKAKLETAKLTFESKSHLFERKVISEYQLKLAKNDLLTAQAAVSQAQANLTNAANDLSFTKVRTLVGGYVGNLPYKVGSLVSPQISEPLTMVSDNSEIYADFSLPENAYLSIVSEQTEINNIPLSLIMNNGVKYKYQGHLHSKSGMISQSTGALPIRSIFPNPETKLLSGGSCQVEFSYQEDKAILIPRSAIKEIQDKLFVFRVEDGKTIQIEISASRYDATNWLLLPNKDGNYPLKSGDIISATTNRMKNDMEVEFK